ncbi:MAG: transposase [Bacteroidales bacterium]|nr:transposase [Bacteroidales bacterium]
MPQDDFLCRSVECITIDLSPTYRQLCSNSFLCAYHVADKFHVIRLLMEAMQDVRIRFRQDTLKGRRVARWFCVALFSYINVEFFFSNVNHC